LGVYLDNAFDSPKNGSKLGTQVAIDLIPAKIFVELTKPARLTTIYNKTNDISKIYSEKRVWGMTEGRVYGMAIDDAPRWRMGIDSKDRDPGMLVFSDQAAELFSPHSVLGPFSLWKRLTGQYRARFGDIVIDEAYQLGDRVYVTRAHIGTHAGQSTATARWRATQREIFDVSSGAVGLGFGGVLFFLRG
jgi:hypothetical protein